MENNEANRAMYSSILSRDTMENICFGINVSSEKMLMSYLLKT